MRSDRKFLFYPGKNMDVLLNLNICFLSEKAAFSGLLTYYLFWDHILILI